MNTKQPGTKPFVRQAASSLLRVSSKFMGVLTAIPGATGLAIDWIRLRYVDYIPRPDDIFIVTYPRSGTTWMQMILYQLATDGNMDFTHISEVIPWFERFSLSGRDIGSLPSPRIFKTHLPHKFIFGSIPKGPCKYIYLARNGKDVAVSYFHFYTSHLGYRGTFSEFFDRFMRGRVRYGSWFKHVAGWRSRRDDPNVLFLEYEDLIHDLAGNIQKIANFCGFEVQPERLPIIVERCNFAFMKEHEDKFDHAMEVLLDHEIKLGSFLRKGQTNYGKEYLSNEQEALFEQEFEKWLGGKN